MPTSLEGAFMMPNAKEEFQNRIKTICLFCREEVEKKQIIKGKVICEVCDVSVFNAKVPRQETPDEYYKSKRQKEEEMITKLIKQLILKKL